VNQLLNSHEAHYRILNLNVSIESDSKELLDRFDQDYGWFRVPNGSGRPSLAFSAQFQGEAPGLACAREPMQNVSEPSATIPPQPAPANANILHSSFFPLHSFLGHPSPLSFALQQMVRTLFSELTDFIVLHAGVLEKDGQALILSGPPGVGKSTLTLALLERGFRFLSDDFCPMGRETGSVYPFPRSVWMVDPERKRSLPEGRPGKRCIAPEQLPGSVCPSPCIPKWLICLDPGVRANQIHLEAGLREEGEQAFIQDMARIPEVHPTRLSPHLHEWQIAYPADKGLSTLLRQVIDRHRNHIWNIYRSDRAQPDFDRPPAMIPLSVHEAALRIMGELKQEPDAIMGGQAEAERPAAFFATLIGLLSGMACYHLTVGELAETIRQIETITE
jgi:hypothetical protein